MSEAIFEDKPRNLIIRSSSTYSPTFLALLERTVFGSGGLKYTINGMVEILNRIKNPHFITLEVNGCLIGVLTLIQKTTHLLGKDYPAFYSYGLAIETTERGKGYGTILSEQALQYGIGNLGENGIYYGYVEAENIHSLKTIQKVGRKSLGKYHSLIISRLYPRDNDFVEKLNESQKDLMIKLLYEQYGNHSLIDLKQGVKPDNYYILKQENEIIVGLQIERNHLTIKHLPGIAGFLLLKVLPYTPIIRKLLPHKNYHFLRLGNIYVKQGHEKDLFNLIEVVLARHRMNFGMVNIDKRSPVYRRLEEAGGFGVFNAMVNVPVHVMAYLKGFTESEITQINRQPLFISMNDPV